MSGDLVAFPAAAVAQPDVRALSDRDQADLARAFQLLERTSFATRLGGLIGRQIGFAAAFVPARVAEVAHAAADKALGYALRGAVRTLGTGRRPAATKLHVAAVAASGALGGALGLATLPIELPVSTALILRGVADIAREEGETLDTPDSLLACLEVFALGDGSHDAASGESSYFAVRTVLAKSVSEAARYMVQRGVGDEAAPVIVRLLGQLSSRFVGVVSQKLLAQTLPLIGAVTGAAINAAFMDHYQTLARGHFIVRRLERTYGPDLVRAAYEALRRARESEAGPTEAADAVAARAMRALGALSATATPGPRRTLM